MGLSIIKTYKVWYLSSMGFNSVKVSAINWWEARKSVKKGLNNMGACVIILFCRKVGY